MTTHNSTTCRGKVFRVIWLPTPQAQGSDTQPAQDAVSPEAARDVPGTEGSHPVPGEGIDIVMLSLPNGADSEVSMRTASPLAYDPEIPNMLNNNTTLLQQLHWQEIATLRVQLVNNSNAQQQELAMMRVLLQQLVNNTNAQR